MRRFSISQAILPQNRPLLHGANGPSRVLIYGKTIRYARIPFGKDLAITNTRRRSVTSHLTGGSQYEEDDVDGHGGSVVGGVQRSFVRWRRQEEGREEGRPLVPDRVRRREEERREEGRPLRVTRFLARLAG